jgi:hypothetical protein
MKTNHQQIQSFVYRDIAPWIAIYPAGPWLTQETAARFQTFVEREAVAYVEERALTEAVASALGLGNPATPFVVMGLKQVLDAETPVAIRFAREHPEVGLAGACVFLILLWKFAPN